MNSGGLHDTIDLEENDDIQSSGSHTDAPEQQPMDADEDNKMAPSGARSSTNSSLEREIESVKQHAKVLLDSLASELKTALEKDDDIIASLAALRERALGVEDNHRKKLDCIEKTVGSVMSSLTTGKSN
ncbi:uncharacterized protein ISCGN_017859 [Ixodes scapularis]